VGFFVENKTRKFGFLVRIAFAIELHKKDKVFLEKIQNYFGFAPRAGGGGG